MSPKRHVAVDALGNPSRVRLTPGRRHEATQAHAPVEGLGAGWVIADTAFDADPFRARLAEQGIGAVIPANRARPKPIAHEAATSTGSATWSRASSAGSSSSAGSRRATRRPPATSWPWSTSPAPGSGCGHGHTA